MKYLKIVGVSALAALALTAIAGAGTSSATVLCANESTPCTSPYGAGTELQAHLKEGTVAILEAGFTTIQCKQATVDMKVENAGSAATTVSGGVTAISFGECSCEVKMLKNGSKEIHNISGTYNGTVTGTGSQGTVNCLGVDCIYGTNNTDLGIFVGGNKTRAPESVTLPRISGSFACASTAKAKAEYELPKPSPLYVAPS